MDVVEKLDAQLDAVLGENPAEEEHHDDANIGAEAPITDDSVVEEISPEEMNGDESGMESMEDMKPSEPGDMGNMADEDMKSATPGVVDFEEDLENNKGV
jgi:hypothetical protein